MIEKTSCPLCTGARIDEFSRDKRRTFLQCGACGLVFVLPSQFLSKENEKHRYDLHQNSPEDAGYREHLKRLLIPLLSCLSPGSRGLDFGSGPSPTLSLLFEEAGYTMTIFDYFYEPDRAPLEKQYDFITATEVVEHLHNPGKELERLWACLKQGGRLGIMTKPVVDRDAFSRWHYKNDLTHVCFFSRKTFNRLAEQWKAEVTFVHDDVVLFRK
jgi:SAM-dependent methyltransferase